MSEAILATFADVKFIRTRSTMQLVLELPIEQADEALKALGGVPQPGTERWVGVALAPKERKGLVDSNFATPKLAAEARGRRPFNSLPLSTQAAIRCNDNAFCDFLAQQSGQDSFTPEQAAQDVRNRCDVMSRSEIAEGDKSGDYWLSLEAAYQAHVTDLRYGSGIK